MTDTTALIPQNVDGSVAPKLRCSACGLAKPVTKFHSQGGGKRHCYCKGCYNARYRGKRRPKSDPVARRAQNIKTRYGLTVAAYDALLTAQGGVCAICLTPPTKPVVDHCHQSGSVRGILCHGCNIALPAVEDASWRSAALRYLEARS